MSCWSCLPIFFVCECMGILYPEHAIDAWLYVLSNIGANEKLYLNKYS